MYLQISSLELHLDVDISQNLAAAKSKQSPYKEII